MGATSVRNCNDIEPGLALLPSDGLTGCMLLSAFTTARGYYVRGLVGWKFLET